MRLRTLTRTAAGLALGGLALLAGCGGDRSTNPVNAAGVGAKHGGTVLPLPFGKGFAEVVVEPVKSPTKAASGTLAVYFMTPDGSSALTPTEVTFAPDGKPAVPLEAKDDHFVSKPGPYAPGRDVAGELAVKLGGDTLTVPVQTR